MSLKGSPKSPQRSTRLLSPAIGCLPRRDRARISFRVSLREGLRLKVPPPGKRPIGMRDVLPALGRGVLVQLKCDS